MTQKIGRRIIKQITNKITKNLRSKIMERTVLGMKEKNRNKIKTTKVCNQ